MKKLYVLLLLALFPGLTVFSQMYILNEDFSGAAGTTPPAGWTSTVVTGGPADSWHFDNPGARLVNYPATEPVAIFDSEFTSDDGLAEEVYLETPIFDASVSNFILLNFQHILEPGTGGSARIEAYNGSIWWTVANYSSATANPASEVIDLSPICGGVSSARLRFTWSGNGSGYWALDNIRIYASQPLDGGMVSIDQPSSPVAPGLQSVRVTIGNFGYNTITSATINWSVNGTIQPKYDWTGAAGFGMTVSDVNIGSYNFQTPVTLKAWLSLPNGQPDPNPYNDTITKYLQIALCGTYTIGGNNPDFESVGDAVDALNAAGVTCPVTFLLRDGTYYEQFVLHGIPGSSGDNPVLFRSESGDSTAAVIRIIPSALKYEPMIFLEDASHVTFRQVGFSTGATTNYANTAVVINSGEHIAFENCGFFLRNQYDLGISARGGTSDLDIRNNRFESVSIRAIAMDISGAHTRDISISGNFITGATEWGQSTVMVANGARNVSITGNTLERCFRAIHVNAADSITISGNVISNVSYAVYAEGWSLAPVIAGNRISGVKGHQNAPDGTSAIYLGKTSSALVYNNFIHVTGDIVAHGIGLFTTTGSRVYFNSVNVTNNDVQGRSKGFFLWESSGTVARNNIFQAAHDGIPVYLETGTLPMDFDRNNYFGFGGTVGMYNDVRHGSIEEWFAATGLDAASQSVRPFFTSPVNLAMNQVLLNNAGVPVPGITTDIDGIARDPVTPDPGAREYDPCSIDAGINALVSPQNPLSGGVQTVRVMLQNQGTGTLSSARIHWLVNGEEQPVYLWTGSLNAGNGAEVTIGDYDFQAGIIYSLKIYTGQPNNTSDCNNANDTIMTVDLAAPLCGSYTIGGENPHFETFSEAVKVLNLAGVGCPVTLLVRDGIYTEQFNIREIRGSSPDNTVTFRSESGDSSKATLKINPTAQKFETLMYLQGTRHARFRDLGFVTGTNTGSSNNAVILESAENIEFSGCYIELQKDSDLGVGIRKASRQVRILDSRFECLNSRAAAIYATDDGTAGITIKGNHINGGTDLNIATIKLGKHVDGISLAENRLERCYRAVQINYCDSVSITGNIFHNVNDGLFIDEWSQGITISGNRFSQVKSHPDNPDGTSGIYINNTTQVEIFNNFIHTTGQGVVNAINLQRITGAKVVYNSVNLTNKDFHARSKGLQLRTSTGVTIRNNIFNCAVAGTPVHIAAPTPQLAIGHNNYYSFDRSIGFYNGNTYLDLQTWADSLADAGSVSAPPFFLTPEEMTFHQVLLNNAGTPIEGITDDIDGNPRHASTPDMGAREYTPCATDAGINAILSPEGPLSGGSFQVRARLQNHGTSVLTSAKINWQVNNEVQAPFAWTGNLASGAGTEVTVGTYNYLTGILYTVKVWTSEPNGQVDCASANDTLFTPKLAGPLCGTYTIGGANPDFTSVSDAALVLNLAGITCPVEFVIRDGTYEEQFKINHYSGSSPDRPVVFRSESGNSAQAILRIAPTAIKFESMIYLSGAQHISFRNLGLYTGTPVGSANNAATVEGASDIHFDQCYFEVKKESDMAMVIQGGSRQVKVTNSHMECVDFRAGGISVQGAGTSDVEISGNSLRGAAIKGNVLFRIGSGTRRILVDGNTADRCYRFLYMTGADSVTVSSNRANDLHEGINVDNSCTNIQLLANRFTNVLSHQNSPEGTNGIYARNTVNLEVINNFVHSRGDGPVHGIQLQAVTDLKLHFNSVNNTNNDAQSKSNAILLKGGSGVAARNNIVAIKSKGTPFNIDQAVTGLNMDYNNYYHPQGVIGKANGQTYSDLQQWGQLFSGDANSKVVNPYFKADSIPLPFQRALNGAGIPIPGILFDIEGKLRFAQAPDIGCLEFFVDYGVLELLSPTLNCYHPDVDSVIVYIRQYGDVPFNDLKVAYRLDNGPVHTDTIPGPLYEDVIHTFGTTENISTYGDYLFKIWLINTLDDNINNDTLKTWRYSKPPPAVSMSWDNFCTGWTVNFSGQATVEAPYFIEKYEWLFGDGATSDEQNPTHAFTSPGTYDVAFRAYSNAGCYSEVITPVYIDPDFLGLAADYLLVPETCLGDGTGRLELQAFGGYPPYTYFINGTQVSDPVVTSFPSGSHEIRIVDSQNCIFTDSLTSMPEVFLDPQIFADPLTGHTPLSVQFDFTANNPATWTWYFTETDTSNSHAPSFIFTEYGTHTVVLEVMSGHPHYCLETATVDIFVDIIVTIEANNVFTPNGDGYNDYFEVRTTGIRDLKVNIANQWGNKVYKIEEVGGKWDGNTKGGTLLPDGTYYYHVEAVGFDNKVYTRQGSVLLLRHAAEAFPNPALDKVTVKTGTKLEAPVYYTVYSLYGQVAAAGTVNEPENILIDLSKISKGIYFIRVYDDKHAAYVRIIKN